jgi:hypothetical protein
MTGKPTRAELKATFDKAMGDAALERQRFRAYWPYIFFLSRLPPDPGELSALRVMTGPGYPERYDAAIAWAKENLTHYAILGGEIGISDSDEAFWFKMTWG